ncbi:hypothetical protein [Bacillus capparidis]|uniref:Uncharacterized protein n=1 Tax=Bacillus capparidis TaxID=1840411 RepID=A0ABS4CX16_9BACI|nr:hypothetical protein [Bacillus capparidis]MBP1082134.1 hypothetical protein [Bacillus capparidis]MED1096753.1 hypothetical protein [Bacillus capparidis]
MPVAVGITIPNVGEKKKGKAGTVSVQMSKAPTVDSQFDKLFKYLEPVLQYLRDLNSQFGLSLKMDNLYTIHLRYLYQKDMKMLNSLSIGTDFYDFAKNWVENGDAFEKL